MSVNNVSNNIPNVATVQKVAAPPVSTVGNANATGEAKKPVRASDRVELSGVGNFLQILKRNDVRADKVASIKAQIDAGTYDETQKLDVASDRLLDDLLK